MVWGEGGMKGECVGAVGSVESPWGASGGESDSLGRNSGLRAKDATVQQRTEVASPNFRAAVGNGEKRKE